MCDRSSHKREATRVVFGRYLIFAPWIAFRCFLWENYYLLVSFQVYVTRCLTFLDDINPTVRLTSLNPLPSPSIPSQHNTTLHYKSYYKPQWCLLLFCCVTLNSIRDIMEWIIMTYVLKFTRIQFLDGLFIELINNFQWWSSFYDSADNRLPLITAAGHFESYGIDI